MFAVLLSLALAQAPGAPAAPSPDLVVLPVVRPRVISRELAERTAHAVEEGLIRAGYSVMSPREREARLGKQEPADCQNNTTCFALIGRSLGTPIVVRVEGGVVETDLAVYLQALRSDDGTEIASQSIVTQTDAPDEKIGRDVAPFIGKLLTTSPPKTRLAAPEQVAAEGAHENAAAGGTLTPPGEPVVVSGPSRPMWPLAPAAAGVIAAGVGAAFLVQAGATHASLVDPLPPGGTPWTPSQRTELVNRGNFQQTLGWTLVGVGAAAAATGAVLYFTSSSNDTRVALTAGPGGVLAQGRF